MALLAIWACSPEITFTPTLDEEPEEVETPNNKEENETEEEKSPEEDENEDDKTQDEEKKEDETQDETQDEEKTEDEEQKTEDETETEDEEDNTEVNNPGINNDITPWSGSWATDAGMDYAGSDADFYYEANSFTSTVVVTFNGDTAAVESSNSSIKSNVSGAYVTIDMLSNSVSGVEIIAIGSSSDGGLKIYGDKKFKLTLSGLDLASKRGPAINSQCKKRMFLHLTDGTTNRITDIANYTDDAYTLPGS